MGISKNKIDQLAEIKRLFEILQFLIEHGDHELMKDAENTHCADVEALETEIFYLVEQYAKL